MKHLLIITVAAQVVMLLSMLSAQEGDFFDECSKQEQKDRSTYTGEILFGDSGATSQLDRERSFKKYMPGNAFDGDLKTSWVEGAADEGKGEILAFYSSSAPGKIGIVPGYGTARHFRLNNRVKTAKLEISVAARDVTQCSGLLFRKKKTLFSNVLTFKDSMEMQYYNISKIPGSADGYIFTIEILSVYPGNRYNDTCIAEVAFE